jgi:alpha-galactosidase
MKTRAFVFAVLFGVTAASAQESTMAASPPAVGMPHIASSQHAPEPHINGPRIVGATPGKPFLFLIPATGDGPLKFSAKRLPADLTLDASTGIISGSLKRAGTNVVEIIIQGPHGVARCTLTIVGGEHKLALTPPMGWNSWNIWHRNVDENKVRVAADWMIKTGLAAHGYQYVNIDDCWEDGRDTNGEITVNKKFGDMKALADYVHGKGLKLGIYSSPGQKTCAGFEASFGHEDLDARTYASWGIDYVKYDWCSYSQVARELTQQKFAALVPELADQLRALTDQAARLSAKRPRSQQENDQLKLANQQLEEIFQKLDPDKRKQIDLEIFQAPYKLFRASLDKCDRDIVYSLCQYGMGDVWKWGAEIGGNLWRTTGDITGTYRSMSGIGFGQSGHEKFAGPGHWNDPDMLWLHSLAPNEQLTHLSLWSLLAAPLLIGSDLSNLNSFTLDALSNDEVIDVDQDPLGVQGSRRAKDGDLEVWAKPLSDGTLAVGLFNRGSDPKDVVAKWSELGLNSKQPVRDIWQRKDLGPFTDAFSAAVPSHGVVLIKVGAAKSSD